jgi:hypothetical protein
MDAAGLVVAAGSPDVPVFEPYKRVEKLPFALALSTSSGAAGPVSPNVGESVLGLDSLTHNLPPRRTKVKPLALRRVIRGCPSRARTTPSGRRSLLRLRYPSVGTSVKGIPSALATPFP